MNRRTRHPPEPLGTYGLPPVQMLGMSVAFPFMLMAQTILKIPLWLAGMALAVRIIRAGRLTAVKKTT